MERKKLKVWRLEAGLTQDKLSELSGVDQTTISLIEVGKRKKFSAGVMQALAKSLKVEIRQVEEFDSYLQNITCAAAA